MLQQTRGIVLNHIKYSDSTAIAHIYTEHFGRLSIMVRHSNSKKSVSKKSILQPLFLLVLDIQYKQTREIQQAREIINSPVFNDIPFHVSKSAIAIFLAEVLMKVLKEEEANPALFEFLYHSIQLFDHCYEGSANFHLVFLLELTKHLGFYPENNHSPQNKFFNIREGFYSENVEMPEIYLDEELSENLNQISRKGFKLMSELKLSGNQRTIILEALIKYYQYHLIEMGQIKSLPILKQIFSAGI